MHNGWTFSSAAQAHRRRCMGLPPLQVGEAERLMAEFLLAPTADAGKVRLGGYAPALAPTADAGKVRPGAHAAAPPAGHTVKSRA
jgi:hypothetical protein